MVAENKTYDMIPKKKKQDHFIGAEEASASIFLFHFGADLVVTAKTGIIITESEQHL